MSKFEISIEAGLLMKGQVRRLLEKTKRDLLWNNPQAYVEIYEESYFLESEFTFRVKNINEVERLALLKYFQKIDQETL